MVFAYHLGVFLKKDFTYLTIFSEGKVEFTHFILPAEDDKPDRIVIDLKNAVHQLPKYNYIDLPWDMITAIRTSQYQVKPEKITRIVLDLKEPVVYRIMEKKKDNEAILAISTKKGEPSFSWAAVSEMIKKDAPKKTDIKKKDKFVKKEIAPAPEKKTSKAEVKITKKDQPQPEKQKPEEFPKVVEKPPFKETKPSTSPIEMKKEKGPTGFMNFMIDKKWVTIKINK